MSVSDALNERLTPAESLSVQRNMLTVSYQKGQLIHHHDGNCLGLFHVVSGQVSVSMLSDEGREITLFRLNAGDDCVLSAACVIHQLTFDVHVEAETDAVINILPAHILSALMEENVAVESYAYKLAAEHFSDAMWSLQQILFFSVDRRIASFLWEESARVKSATLTFTHEQIARLTGSAREVVSRTLNRFSREGLVTLGRGCITIQNKEKLKSLI